MKQSQAVSILQDLMFTLQKARSNAREEMGFGTDEAMTSVLMQVMPKTFDDEAGLLRGVIKVLDHFEQTKQLAPMDFYNLLTMASMEPPIRVLAHFLSHCDLPAPDIRWVADGWTNEEAI